MILQRSIVFLVDRIRPEFSFRILDWEFYTRALVIIDMLFFEILNTMSKNKGNLSKLQVILVKYAIPKLDICEIDYFNLHIYK